MFAMDEIDKTKEIKAAIEELLKSEDMARVNSILRGLWQFCSYLLVPQWGRIKRNE